VAFHHLQAGVRCTQGATLHKIKPLDSWNGSLSANFILMRQKLHIRPRYAKHLDAASFWTRNSTSPSKLKTNSKDESPPQMVACKYVSVADIDL
jgi:hypothetical protein